MDAKHTLDNIMDWVREASNDIRQDYSLQKLTALTREILDSKFTSDDFISKIKNLFNDEDLAKLEGLKLMIKNSGIESLTPTEQKDVIINIFSELTDVKASDLKAQLAANTLKFCVEKIQIKSDDTKKYIIEKAQYLKAQGATFESQILNELKSIAETLPNNGEKLDLILKNSEVISNLKDVISKTLQNMPDMEAKKYIGNLADNNLVTILKMQGGGEVLINMAKLYAQLHPNNSESVAKLNTSIMTHYTQSGGVAAIISSIKKDESVKKIQENIKKFIKDQNLTHKNVAIDTLKEDAKILLVRNFIENNKKFTPEDFKSAIKIFSSDSLIKEVATSIWQKSPEIFNKESIEFFAKEYSKSFEGSLLGLGKNSGAQETIEKAFKLKFSGKNINKEEVSNLIKDIFTIAESNKLSMLSKDIYNSYFKAFSDFDANIFDSIMKNSNFSDSYKVELLKHFKALPEGAMEQILDSSLHYSTKRDFLLKLPLSSDYLDHVLKDKIGNVVIVPNVFGKDEKAEKERNKKEALKLWEKYVETSPKHVSDGVINNLLKSSVFESKEKADILEKFQNLTDAQIDRIIHSDLFKNSIARVLSNVKMSANSFNKLVSNDIDYLQKNGASNQSILKLLKSQVGSHKVSIEAFGKILNLKISESSTDNQNKVEKQKFAIIQDILKKSGKDFFEKALNTKIVEDSEKANNFKLAIYKIAVEKSYIPADKALVEKIATLKTSSGDKFMENKVEIIKNIFDKTPELAQNKGLIKVIEDGFTSTHGKIVAPYINQLKNYSPEDVGYHHGSKYYASSHGGDQHGDHHNHKVFDDQDHKNADDYHHH